MNYLWRETEICFITKNIFLKLFYRFACIIYNITLSLQNETKDGQSRASDKGIAQVKSLFYFCSVLHH